MTVVPLDTFILEVSLHLSNKKNCHKIISMLPIIYLSYK